MRSKKLKAGEPSPEQIALEKRVDAIMSPNGIAPTTQASSTPIESVADATSEPLDIFKGVPAAKLSGLSLPTTAPEVPHKGVSKPTKANIAITQTANEDAEPSVFDRISVNRVAQVAAPKVPLGQLSPRPTQAPVTETSPPTTSIPSVTPLPSSAVTVSNLARKDSYTDTATDTAVADIQAHEGDDLLAAEDAARALAPRPLVKGDEPSKFRKLFRKQTLVIIIILLFVAVGAVPKTRYAVAGLVVKQTLAVTVVDSKTAQPVDGAAVSLHGVTATTDVMGHTTLRVPVGAANLTISKRYYQSFTQAETVSFGQADPLKISFKATGRAVPVSVTNRITGKPLVGATITALNTTAITNAQGQTSIVLPADKTSTPATVGANNYNQTAFTLQITGTSIAANQVQIVPKGSIFFLSKDDGKIDVVKTNLDGSNAQTVLAATGEEDPANTTLQMSADGQFAVLKSRRENNQIGLYLLSASNTKVTQFESSNATYATVGWLGHDFVYDAVLSATPNSQAGHEVLKSYDADQLSLNLLDQDKVSGSGNAYAYQAFGNFYLVGNQVTYTKQWQVFSTSGASYDLSSQNDSISTSNGGGATKHDYQTFPAVNVSSIQAVHYQPAAVYYSVYTASDSSTTYYGLAQSNVSEVSASQASSSFGQTLPNYYLSPDGTKTYWSELRSSQQTLVIGNADGTTSNALNGGAGLQARGWLGNQYVLAIDHYQNYYVVPVSGGAAVKVGSYL